MAGYRLSKAAADDLVGIRFHTRHQWGDAKARLYLTQLRERLRWLAAAPERGRRRTSLGEGLYSYPEGRHVIFYRITDTVIEVVRVLHERMDVGRHVTEHR